MTPKGKKCESSSVAGEVTGFTKHRGLTEGLESLVQLEQRTGPEIQENQDAAF